MSYVVAVDEKELAKSVFASLLIRGVVALVFGVLLLLWPKATVGTIIVLFGIFALIDGVVAIIAGFIAREGRLGWTVFSGVVSLAVGVVMIRHVEFAVVVVVILIGAWSLVGGLLMTIGSFSVRKIPGSPWVLVLITGLLSAVFGLFLVVEPLDSAKVIAIVVGVYGVVVGVLMLTLALLSKKAFAELTD